jgi:xylitol oxidase
VSTPLRNWAGNLVFHAAHVHRPASVVELQEIVAGSDRLRAVGTGHSFSPVADTTGDLISLADLPVSVDLDPATSTVTTTAAVRYGELATLLHSQGWALPNLGSLPHISVAGACSTGTHGSGRTLGCLASSVSAIELVRPDGELVTMGRDDPSFPGAVVALGCLGVVTAITLDVVPTFDVRQTVYEGLSRTVLYENFDEVFDSGYSVSVFTDWRGGTARVWHKERVGDHSPELGAEWLGATAATEQAHPVSGMDPASATEQLGRPGPWHERLPHFRLDFTPSAGEELQTEYLVGREHGIAACEAVERIREQVSPALYVSEIRTVAADDMWLSPCHGRDTVAVHFTWVPDIDLVTPAMYAVERALEPFDPRPHWGKLFTTPPDVVRGRYPRLGDFQQLRRTFDPDNKLGNGFVDRYLADA